MTTSSDATGSTASAVPGLHVRAAVPVRTVLLVVAVAGRCWRYAIPFLVLVPLKLGVEWLVIKQLIDRGRPWEMIGGDLVLRGEVLTNSGFPSGHATTASAFTVLLCAFVPRRWWSWLPLLLAAWVGIARLYFAQHNPLDPVGGFAIGAASGVVPWMLFLDRYAVSAGDDRWGA